MALAANAPTTGRHRRLHRFVGRGEVRVGVRGAVGQCGPQPAEPAVGEAEQGIEYLRRAVDLNHAESGPDHRDTLQAMQSLASAIAGTGRFEEALPMFEQTLAQEARRHNTDGVICGHIHTAEIRKFGDIVYYNDGDWVEGCTALVEHFDGRIEILHWGEEMRVRRERSLAVAA